MKRTRRCDSRCHNAKGKHYTCCWGGRYHGVGALKADEFFFEDLLKQAKQLGSFVSPKK